MSFTASCKSRCLALFLCKRSFSAMRVPPNAASKRRTTWKRPDLLTMTCWLPDMMLNFDGAVAFLSSSPMVGGARGGWLLKRCQGEEFTVLAARAAQHKLRGGPVWAVEGVLSASGRDAVRYRRD